jgi:hypothetical protein
MKLKRVKLDQLKPGPIRHDELSPSLIARIASMQKTLEEVFPQTLEKWLDSFQRDAHPENEVAWWERVARCYTDYTSQHELNPKQKQAVFKIIFTLAMGSTVEDNDLVHLSPDAVGEILTAVRTQIRQ